MCSLMNGFFMRSLMNGCVLRFMFYDAFYVYAGFYMGFMCFMRVCL